MKIRLARTVDNNVPRFFQALNHIYVGGGGVVWAFRNEAGCVGVTIEGVTHVVQERALSASEGSHFLWDKTVNSPIKSGGLLGFLVQVLDLGHDIVKVRRAILGMTTSTRASDLHQLTDFFGETREVLPISFNTGGEH